MAQVLNGTFSIKDVLQLTYQSKFKNRFDYMERDVLKSITVQKVKKFNVDRLDAPEYKFIISTKSYPQYKPYISVKSRGAKKQRTIKHQYDIIFETTDLSINNKNWKMRIGSQKNPRKAPQSQIQSIYKENLKLWDKKRIERHRASKKQYLDNGDWNAQVLGINGDWLFRAEWCYHYFGHLYGRNRAVTPPNKTNSNNLMFFPKHAIRFIEVLMNKGILKDN